MAEPFPEPYLGEIKMLAMEFAPEGWALCNGQVLNIAENPALFSLLGTTYGGNGTTTFALPDMRGRVPVHRGTDSWGNDYKRGEKDGAETVILKSTEMPAHSHSLYGTETEAEESVAGTEANRVFAATKSPVYATPGSELTTLSTNTCTSVGGGAPHNNVQPSLVINFAIALSGTYPPRN